MMAKYADHTSNEPTFLAWVCPADVAGIGNTRFRIAAKDEPDDETVPADAFKLVLIAALSALLIIVGSM